MSRRNHDSRTRPTAEGVTRASSALVSPNEVLRGLAEGKVQVFCASVREDGTYLDPVYRSVKRTATQIGEDYGARFVLELVQNAYDAHPPDTREGAIRVLLDPAEGADGTLYVANRGQPFLRHNVEALCNVGLSDKKIGQTIGNKGLGFRSVRLVSDDPQIFSRRTHGGSGPFDGFCFRFARGDDFDDLVPGAVPRKMIKKDSPPFWAPIPLTAEPPHVAALAREGFATVVRIPLRSASALEAALEEVNRLNNAEAPLLLFLRRLRALDVSVVGKPELSFTLRREADAILVTGEGDDVERVDLGAVGQYLVVWRSVPEADVLHQIKRSVEKNRLDPEWLSWEGEGEVALAVRLDDELEEGRSYTFLPMGEEAEAPLAGHLHASFFAKVDRRTLDLDVPLNHFYLEEAMRLAAVAVESLCQGQLPALDEAERRGAVADLLSWCDVARYSGMAKALAVAFAKRGAPLRERPVIPVLTRPKGEGWAQPGEVWVWDRDDVAGVTAKQLAGVGAAILDPALGPMRIERLEEALEEWGCRTTPDAASLAERVEQIAGALHRRKASRSRWQAFYQDLPLLFARSQEVLAGKTLLLGADGRLHPTLSEEAPVSLPGSRGRAGRTRTVFFPPQRASDDAVSVPQELQRGIAFLKDLGWYDELRAVRSFLDAGKLVAPYDTDALVAQVSRRVLNTKSSAVRRQGLRWVFRLHKSSSDTERPIALRRARLFVPTRTGKWIPAQEAIFSAGWPEATQGDLMARFLALASPHDENLATLEGRLLASPDDEVFAGDRDGWADFLREIGVRGGFRLRAVLPQNVRVKGQEISPERLARRFGLGQVTTALWKAEAEVSGERPRGYLQSNHAVNGQLYVLPGQESYDRWPVEARILFAELVLRLLRGAVSTWFEVSFYHPKFRYDSRVRLPTPFASFLRQAAWFPVQPTGEPDAPPSFVRPEQAWLASDEDRLPRYFPWPSLEVRRLLRAEGDLVAMLSHHARVNVWGDDASSPRQAADLARLLGEGGVKPFHVPELVNDYVKAWATLVKNKEVPDWGGEPRYLIVRRGDGYHTVALSEPGEGEAVYVRDTPDELVPSLLQALDRSVFAVALPSGSGLGSYLARLLGERFRAVSAISLEVVTDGVPLSDVPLRPLIDVAPALPALVLLAAASLRGTLAMTLPTDRQRVVKAFHGVELATAQRLAIQVDGAPVPLPQTLRGTVGLSRGEAGVVVLESSGELSWDDLHRTAAPSCELAGYSALEQPLKLAFRAMERVGDSVGQPLGEAARRAVTEELGLDAAAATAGLLPLQGDPTLIRPMLRTLAHYFSGEAGLAAMDAQGEAAVEHAVAAVAESAGGEVSPQVLLQACREATSYRDLLFALDLDLSRLNRSLAALGERAITNPEGHAQALRVFVSQNRSVILAHLREPFVAAFERGDDLDAYVAARDALDRLRPDPAWASTVWEPDESLLRAHVDSWLDDHAAPPLASPLGRTEDPTAIRRTNYAAAQDLVAEAARVVTAWCIKHAAAVPSPWDDPRGAPVEIAGALDGRALFDFDVLTRERLLAATAAVGWPEGMPHTLDSAALGLTEEDLDAEERHRRQEREAKDRERRSVSFGGEVLDPDELDRTAGRVSERLSEAVATGGVPPSIDDVSALVPVGGGGGSKGGSGSGRKGRSSRRMDERAAGLVGFLGECVVYHWLRRCYPDLSIDQAWRSGLREHLLPGSGDDGLGYDFELRLPHQTVFIEVKAHMGDPGEFELGETEVRKARDCVRSESEVYRVIYVSNVSDPEVLRIDVLPNPLEGRTDGVFRMVGEGLRFRFRKG